MGRDRDRERTRAEKKDVQNEREGRKYAKKKRRRRRSEERERQWRRFLLIPSKAKPSPTTSRPSAEARGGFFSTMAQGFALGTGSAIAHEAIHGAVRSFSGMGYLPYPDRPSFLRQRNSQRVD